MASQVDELSPILVELKVEVPWTKVNEGLEDAYKTLQKKAKVRGFRPGKVPRHVVKKLMGKSVRAEVAANLIRQSLGEAVDEHKLPAVAFQEVDEAAIEEGQPLTYTAKVEVRPKIETVDISKLEVEQETVKIGDEAIDNEIQRLRQENADLVSPDPARPSKAGDILTIDMKVIVDGEERADMGADNYQIEVGSGRLLEELEEAAVGLEVNQDKDVLLTFPEDFTREELRGKDARFKIHVQDLRERQLPEVDDEFARDLEHESLEALRSKVRADLEETAERRSKALLREAVVDKLIDDNPIPVPPSLVEQQQRALLQEMLQFQQMLGQFPNLGEDFLGELKTRAERKVRAGLLFGELSRSEQLEVSDADVDAKLSEIADQSGKHIAKVRADYQGERRELLETQLLENKLLDYLLSKATIREVTAKSSPAEETNT